MAFFPTEQLGEKRKKAVLRSLPPIPAADWRAPESLPDLRDACLLSFDTETFDPDLLEHGPGWSRGSGHVVGVSIGALSRQGDRWAGYLPLRHTVAPETNMPTGGALAWIKAMLETPAICKTGANLLYDVGWLAEDGIDVQGKLYDVQFAEVLLHERNKVALEVLGKKYCGQGKESPALYEWCAQAYGGAANAAQRANIYRAPPSLVGAYAESDAALPIDILQKQWPLLERDNLIDLFELECSLIPLLVQMRQSGVTIDLDYVDVLHTRYKKLVDDSYSILRTDYEFRGSVNSSRDLAKLFDTVGIEYGTTADGNPSIKNNWLKTLSHPVAKIVQQVREYDKLRSTFIEGSIKSNHVNGIVHCNFHPLRDDHNGTITGRLSSSIPNLQQIPSRTDEGKLIRKAFVKDEHHAGMLKLDYSQIEYRMLAHNAVGPGSDILRDTYCTNSDADYHDIVQDNVRRLTSVFIDRKPIKNINFGLLYGISKKKLAAILDAIAGITLQQSETIFDAYHTGAPYVLPTMEAIAEEASNVGYITTILGRRTHFDLFEPAGYKHTGMPLPYHAAVAEYGLSLKRAGTYKSINYKFQGSAADVMKVAMAKLLNSGVFAVTGVPRLTVHDELVWSLPTGGKEMLEAIKYVRHVMETAIAFKVPLKAEPEIGDNWGTMQELKGNEQWILCR